MYHNLLNLLMSSLLFLQAYCYSDIFFKIFVHVYLGVELLVFRVWICSTLLGNVKLFPRVVYHFISTCSHYRYIRVASIWYYPSFHFCQSGGYKILSHFDLYVTEYWGWAHVCIHIGRVYFVFCDKYVPVYVFIQVSIIFVFSWGFL